MASIFILGNLTVQQILISAMPLLLLLAIISIFTFYKIEILKMNLNQVTVPVTDVLKSIPFYQSLGLKLIVHTHDRYARFECTPHGATLSLHKVDNLEVGERTILYFEREDLDEYVNQLIAKGLIFEHLPKDQSWLWREAKLYDLDSNPIIIYHAGENRINPPWKFHQKD